MQRYALMACVGASMIAAHCFADGDKRSIRDAAAEIVDADHYTKHDGLSLKFAPDSVSSFEPTDLDPLFGLLQTRDLTLAQRMVALEILARLEDPIVLERLFDVASNWCDGRRLDDIPEPERETLRLNRTLFGAFAREAAVSPALPRVRYGASVSRAVLHSVARPYLEFRNDRPVLGDVAGRIMIDRLTLTPEERSVLVFEAVDASEYVKLFGAPMLFSLLPPEITALRMRLATSAIRGQRFDWKAAEALATIGDEGALAIFEQQREHPALTGGAASSTLHEILTARIAGVQSRENYLTFCDSRFAVESMHWPWLIDWGVRLGLSQEEMRDCMVRVRGAYERRVLEIRQGGAPFGDQRRLSDLLNLRDAAIQRGVFTDTDWPEVLQANEPNGGRVSGF